jgi:hypothetical protein
VAVVSVTVLAGGARAQVPIGYDGVTVDLIEFTTTRGGPCLAPNPVTDVTYITDGRAILSFVGDAACGVPPPCTVISGFIPSAAVPLGAITGLACTVGVY